MNPKSLLNLVFRCFVSAAIGLIGAAVGGPDASAQGRVPVDYHLRAWTTDHGLPHNSVSSVLQDSAGYLWFTTLGGLARFDGREFREIRAPAEHRSYGFNIRGIAEEKPGVLLVVPAGGTVLRLSGMKWSVHPLNTALGPLGEQPGGVHISALGDVWVTTLGGKLFRWMPDGQWRIYGPDGAFARNSRSVSVAPDPSGGIWICGDALWFVDPLGELRRVMELTAAGYIGAGRSGVTWLLVDRKIYQLGPGTVGKEQRLPPGPELTGVRHLHEDTKGGLWIASSRQGLFRFTEGQLHRITSYTSVASVVEDRESNVWVTTDGGGLGQLREKSCRLLNTTHGLAQETVSSLAEDPAGGVWLANRSGGLYRVDDDGQTHPSGLLGARRFANVVNADTTGAVWFGGGRNGLFKWRPGSDSLEQLPSPASDLHVLYRAKNGDMWFAADGNAVGYYREGKLHLLDPALPGLQLIRTIAEDGQGGIWLGGRQGELLRWRDGKIELYNESRGFPRAPVHAIHVDSENRIWVGTAEGLVVKRGESFSLLTEANGLRDDIIEEVVGDQFGCLWFASRRGIFYAEIADLLRAADDASDLIDSHYLGANQGLFGLSPTPNYHPGSLRARDGTLWFATAQGALVVDPVRFPRALPPVPVVIDEVLCDGAALDVSKPIRLASGRHRVEFRFAALSYAAPESVALRHQLEGVDPQWVATPADRSATYTNLPPGEYRLRVIARNSSGQWNTEELVLPLAVIPAWWETWTFKIVAVMFLIVAVATIARKVAQRRLKQRLRLLEQQQALEKERSRIARDLHDELGASLTEVGLLADRLAESVPTGFAPQLSGLAWRTRRLATDLSGIVWTMNARHASLDQLAQFLRRYTERLFRNTDIRCVVEGVERIPAVPLPPDVQHHLLAVTKEALNNILMHARATETRIQLQFQDGVFQVHIRDNGMGFSTDPSGQGFDGNGLRNIRSRIVEIGGTVELTSAPGAGTVVIFQVPFVTSPEPR